ncbi:sialidase family protein [Myroides sp. LJL116]
MNHFFSFSFILLFSSIAFSQSPLDTIFAPIKVATPPSDAYIGLSQLENGEIRHYNYGEQSLPGTFYLSSKDKGLTWDKVPYAKDRTNADVQNPTTKEYIRLTNMGKQGVYSIVRSPDDQENLRISKVADRGSIMLKPPVFTNQGKTIIVAAHGDVSPKGCYTYVSNDYGQTWQTSSIVTVPDHQGGGFHQGIRWNHGAVEPTVVELKDGTLWMIMRTSLDYHYQSFSKDGGLTWSQASPSPFYGTITMPTIGRLSDGSLLMLWCNTTPMPEVGNTNGVWDDVFTNRDVTHAAISKDDGKTWIGFRELYRNPMRNESNYATLGGGVDRGSHQAQFLEVEPGKILVSLGQHSLHRAMVLFDVKWLEETKFHNNFENDLQDWTSFNYIQGIKGHCSYDRIQGVELCLDPENKNNSTLHLSYQQDPNLVEDTRGALWNFGATKKGVLTTNIRITGGDENISLILNDRWFNPSDKVAKAQNIFEIQLNPKDLGISDDKWHTVSIHWDLNQKKPRAFVMVDGKKTKQTIPLNDSSLHGISYAHFIATPNTDKQTNLFIKDISVESLDLR